MIQAGALEILAPIGRVRTVLDDLHPNEAVSFCEGLMELASLAVSYLNSGQEQAMTERQEKSIKLLEVMLLDTDPQARKDIAQILSMMCSG